MCASIRKATSEAIAPDLPRATLAADQPSIMLQNTRLIYFSPTGTGKKVAKAIACGLGSENSESLDLTLPVGIIDAAISPISTKTYG